MSRIRISIRADGLAAEAAAEPGAPATERDVLAALNAAGVVAGIDSTAVAAFSSQLARPTAVPAVVVATGRPASPGVDGRVDVIFASARSVGRPHADGRIDWRERDLLHPVAAGQLVGTIVPPTAGSPGADVRGRAIETKPGKPHTVRFGAGVRTDGNRLLAARAGVVLQDPRQIDVVALYEHPGDVDLRSGNLHSEGSLSVRGDLGDGFLAAAGGDLLIGGSVQHGTATAGGAVHVGGAVLAGSTVRAGADVTARHTTSSRLDAAGTIDLRDEATHSQLRADSIRIVAGRGTAMGGELRARRSIELVQAGTANGAPTMLAVADVTDESVSLVRSTNQDSKVERTASRARREVAGPAGKANRIAMKGQDQAQQQRLAVLQRRRALLQDASITITGTVHAGVRIQFGGVSLPIDVPRTRVRFRWDADQNRILEETLP